MWSPKTELRLLTLAIAFLICGLLFSQDTTSRQYELNSQIVINTQRLADIERRLIALETGGTLMDINTATRVAIVDERIVNLTAEIQSLRNILYIMMGLATTHGLGFIWYLLKPRLFEKPEKPTRHVGGG